MKKTNLKSNAKKTASPKAKNKSAKKFNCYVKFLYTLVAIGYICSLIAVLVLKEPLKEYNTQAIQYVSLANQGLKTYGSIKEINGVVQDQISTAYDHPEEMIEENVESFTESLFSDGSLYEASTTKVKQIQKIAQNKAPSSLDHILKLLVSNKILYTVLLTISFAAFSPIVFIALIFIISTKRKCFLNLSPKAANHFMLLPHIYVTNLILAIFSIVIFYHFTYLGLILAISTHLIFIFQIINGLRLRNNGLCISCGSNIK